MRLRMAISHSFSVRLWPVLPGCSLTAVTAAFLGICDDAQRAATAAVAYFGVCGEIAADGAPGPGTLRVRLLDVLHGLDRDTFLSRIRISSLS